MLHLEKAPKLSSFFSAVSKAAEVKIGRLIESDAGYPTILFTSLDHWSVLCENVANLCENLDFKKRNII